MNTLEQLGCFYEKKGNLKKSRLPNYQIDSIITGVRKCCAGVYSDTTGVAVINIELF